MSDPKLPIMKLGLSSLCLASVLLLTGCAAPATNGSTSTSPTPASPTPTKEPLEVSIPATCMLLFGSNVDGPAADASDIINRFVASPDGSTITVEELRTTIAAIESARDSAGDELAPYIEAQLPPLEALESAMSGEGNRTINFEEFKASGLELITQCGPYL